MPYIQSPTSTPMRVNTLYSTPEALGFWIFILVSTSGRKMLMAKKGSTWAKKNTPDTTVLRHCSGANSANHEVEAGFSSPRSGSPYWLPR
mgnify:CR=1 FL=1